MVQANLVQTNFAAGELDPRMAGRADTSAYQNGARSLLNYALLATGGATRRPGTRYLATLGGKCRLIPFDYDESNRYVLAVRAGSTTVHSATGSVLATLTTPWTEAQLFDLTYSQLGDLVVICHQAVAPQAITRGASWAVLPFLFELSTNGNQVYQPYSKMADATVSLTPSAASGTITLTASSAVFVAGHVGCRFRLYDKEVEITAVASSTSATALCKDTLEGTFIENPFRTKNGSNVVEVTHVAHGLQTGGAIQISGANSIITSSGGAIINSSELNGAKTVTVIDNDLYTITVTTTATGAVDGGGPNVKFQPTGLATRSWDEQLFSSVRGWPRAVAFHEQRLWFGGSPANPSGLYSSRINRFFNFSVGEALDNESIQATIGSDQGAAVRHIVSNRHLQIFTGTAEFFAPRPSNSTYTPGTFTVVRQTSFGCAAVRPAPLDGATVFLQANLKTVREYLYSDSDQSYNATNISLLSSHLIETPVDMAVLQGTSQRGEQYAVLVRNDGTLAVFHSARAEKIAGWVPWALRSGHKVLSVCVVGNVLYLATERDGAYFLERLEADDALSLDCAATYSDTITKTVWTLDARYRGKTVAVVSGDFYLGSYVPNGSDQITLVAPVSTITVGYDYETALETLPPNIQAPDGSTLGKLQRIAEVLVWLDSSLALTVDGQRMILRQVGDVVQLAPDRATGAYRFGLLGYSRHPTVRITQEEPLPVRILAMKYKVVA